MDEEDRDGLRDRYSGEGNLIAEQQDSDDNERRQEPYWNGDRVDVRDGCGREGALE